MSIFLFVGLIVGGVSSIGGTLLGAAFIEFVPNLADKVSKAAPGAVYGVILIAVMFLMPAGAGGFLYAMWRRVVRGRFGRQGVAEAGAQAGAEAVAYEPAGERMPDPVIMEPTLAVKGKK